MQDKIALFQDHKIRRTWDEKREKWYFSVVNIIDVLTVSSDARNYWKVLKNRLKKEGSGVVTNCNHLKMQASDGNLLKKVSELPKMLVLSWNINRVKGSLLEKTF